jgi:hypothetical protein
MKLSILIIIIFFTVLIQEATLCTTAVISGKSSADGRPLLWKHRDSSEELSSIEYFQDGKYDYIGLVNHSDSLHKAVWIGYNSAGFSIMNSASYNLKDESDTTKIKDLEGVLMKKALMVCKNLQDFETLLDTLPKPLGVEANFGVIDAENGAAYYETDNFKYTKFDVNDPEIAPDGYLIRTNYSFSGNKEKGYGFIRYNTAMELFHQAIDQNDLSWKFIIQNVSRSLKHSLTGVDLMENLPKDASEKTYIWFEDYIPRRSSSSSIIIQGVLSEESAYSTTMWAVVGFPLTSVVMPCWLNSRGDMPEVLTKDEHGVSSLSAKALELKSLCFHIRKGSGLKYIDLAVLVNKNNDGMMQKLKLIENAIIAIAVDADNKFRNNPKEKITINQIYKKMSTLISEEMQVLINK